MAPTCGIVLILINFLTIVQCETTDERMDRLEAVIGTLISKNEQLVSENERLNSRLEDLEHTVEMIVGKPQPDSAPLLQPVLQSAIDGSEDFTENERQGTERREHGEKEDSLFKRLEPQVSGSPEVAFHAYHSSSSCYNDGQTLVFDTVLVNKGGGYESSDGVFIAPVRGLYAFSWSVVSPHREYFTAELTLNGSRVGVIVADTYNTDSTGHATGFIVLEVNAGDHVFVRTYDTLGGCTAQSYEHGRTTFTGFLVYDYTV